MLSDEFPALDPSFTVFVASLVSQFVESTPVERMVVFKFDVSADGLQQLARRDMLTEIFIELQLLPGQRVDKRGDELHEAGDEEWH